jgi:hypothetical protein
MSPARVADSDAGDLTRRSKVRACRSHGVTSGPTAEAVKKSAIAAIPGTITATGASWPAANDR